MSSNHTGLICLFIFALSQGVRDAYFGNLFQSVSMFLVAAIAFSISTVLFALFSLVRQPRDLARLAVQPVQLVALNLATAVAWFSMFYGLRFLEPAVVATLFNGIGPLVVLVLGSAGVLFTKSRASWPEQLLYVCLAVTLSGLAAIVLTGQSGLGSSDVELQAGALGIVALGGAAITMSYSLTRRFTDAGIGSDAVMSVRFPLTCVLAVVVEWSSTEAGPGAILELLPGLMLATFMLIVLPSFFVQAGMSRTSPLAANVLRTLGPVFVFLVQQLDGRLQFSGATLACIIAFCIISISASACRTWHEAQATVGKRSTTE